MQAQLQLSDPISGNGNFEFTNFLNPQKMIFIIELCLFICQQPDATFSKANHAPNTLLSPDQSPAKCRPFSAPAPHLECFISGAAKAVIIVLAAAAPFVLIILYDVTLQHQPHSLILWIGSIVRFIEHVDQTSALRKLERIRIFHGNILDNLDKFCKPVCTDGRNKVQKLLSNLAPVRQERYTRGQWAQHWFGGGDDDEFDVRDRKEIHAVPTQDWNELGDKEDLTIGHVARAGGASDHDAADEQRHLVGGHVETIPRILI